MNGQVLVWDGGEHNFRLAIGELRALQQATDVGPLFLLGRMVGSQWFVDDVIETIRLGLIGGGMEPSDAQKLVRKHLEENPEGVYRHVLLATRILKNAVMGYGEHDPVGENQTATETSDETTLKVE